MCVCEYEVARKIKMRKKQGLRCERSFTRSPSVEFVTMRLLNELTSITLSDKFATPRTTSAPFYLRHRRLQQQRAADPRPPPLHATTPLRHPRATTCRYPTPTINQPW